MKTAVFIDGREGTTGLQIYERLDSRPDIELLQIDEEKRKDPAERKKFLNAAEIAFLCLPDEAARESVSLIDNPKTRVIDCSTAHRVAADWQYGFPELSKLHRALIAEGKRVSNPGCHATGFISIVFPLVSLNVIGRDQLVSCFSLTGYSGGGKKMIAQYEDKGRGEALSAPRIYGLGLNHKHLPEMQMRGGLSQTPVFTPIVDDYYKGMATTVPLHSPLIGGRSAKDVWEALRFYYEGQKLVTVAPFGWEEPMIAANRMAGKDSLQLIVCGNNEQTIVTALFDNLGKGASGAAIQNMNLMLGCPEETGLVL